MEGRQEGRREGERERERLIIGRYEQNITSYFYILKLSIEAHIFLYLSKISGIALCGVFHTEVNDYFSYQE